MMNLSIGEIIDLVMPFTEAERYCGNKQIRKSKRRRRFIEALSDYNDGKEVDWTTVLYKDELPNFLPLLEHVE